MSHYFLDVAMVVDSSSSACRQIHAAEPRFVFLIGWNFGRILVVRWWHFHRFHEHKSRKGQILKKDGIQNRPSTERLTLKTLTDFVRLSSNVQARRIRRSFWPLFRWNRWNVHIGVLHRNRRVRTIPVARSLNLDHPRWSWNISLIISQWYFLLL